MGFKYTKAVREAINRHRTKKHAARRVAIDAAAVTIRCVNGAAYKTGTTTLHLRDKCTEVSTWLERSGCILSDCKAIHFSRHEKPPDLKADEQEKRKKAHPTALPVEVVQSDSEYKEAVQINRFIAQSEERHELTVEQARKMAYLGRSAYADLIFSALTVYCEAKNILIDADVVLNEGESGAFERALCWAEEGHATVVVTNDTDVYGIALAKHARTAKLGPEKMFVFDYGVDHPDGKFVDIGRLAAHYTPEEAHAELYLWMSFGTDYIPSAVCSVEEEFKEVRRLFADPDEPPSEEARVFYSRMKKCGITADDYLLMLDWMRDYYAATSESEIPSPANRGWHLDNEGKWRRGSAPFVGAIKAAGKRRRKPE